MGVRGVIGRRGEGTPPYEGMVRGCGGCRRATARVAPTGAVREEYGLPHQCAHRFAMTEILARGVTDIGREVFCVKFIGTGKNKAACIAFLRRFCYNMK